MLLTLFSAVFLIFLIYNPALCTLGATKGLSLWYKQVLPALFPAMAAASFLISRKSIQAALKHLPFPAGTAFLSGLLCGSPMGALTCSGLYASKLLSKRAARWIVCFVQLPSPLFLSGFVASTLLALPEKIRFVFLLCAYLPFFASLVRIGVLLMFFSILSEFLTSAAPQSATQTILIGMLEMTTGISKISSLNTLSLRYKSAICLFLLGFGGICVHIQVRQAWQQSDFPIFRYILVRFLFGLCSSLCFLFLNS